jgi:hypothetical protein
MARSDGEPEVLSNTDVYQMRRAISTRAAEAHTMPEAVACLTEAVLLLCQLVSELPGWLESSR